MENSQPKNFNHPYQPYDIQIQFMNAVYDCIEQSKVGIFESPTDAEEPEWMLEHARQQKRQAALRQRADIESRLAKIRAKERRQKERYEKGEPLHKRMKFSADHALSDEDAEARFLLEDYVSDDDQPKGSRKIGTAEYEGLSATTRELMRKLEGVDGMPKEEEEEIEEELKIFYCSRTHSQLTQFVNELRRVKLPPSFEFDHNAISNDQLLQDDKMAAELKHLTLGSRKNLCINPKVSRLANVTAINEKCLDLQQPGTPAECKCPFLPNKDNKPLVDDFRDCTMARIRDIEDLGILGKKIGICPYYASRPTIKPSEIVTLPYPLLLQKSAREALDLSVRGHVVIIDEAHNLMDAITSIHSASISLAQLRESRIQLGVYLRKFRNRLKGKNRVYVTQTVRLLDSLTTFLETKSASDVGSGQIVQTGDLMTGKGVDQINLYKLMRYLQESKLSRKVDGYSLHVQDEHINSQSEARSSATDKVETRARKTRGSTPVLALIQSFLFALTNPSAEGRIFLSKSEDGDPCLQYLLLDPSHHFREIVQEARAVILAGGTMSPMSDYTNQLFTHLPKDRLTTLSCGHVIPPENLLAWPLSRGPTGLELSFTFERRTNEAIIDELGRAILNLCIAIPDGVVVFFPSYSYLEIVTQRWQKPSATKSSSSSTKSLWDRLSQQKDLFQESKESSNVDETLAAYAQAISRGHGALLLSVVGGKMSEGINFADRLGRGVIVVGLPFANMHSPDWKARLQYIETSTTARGGSQAESKAASREFYENACMRAVNQSIGRAIRHQNDYAVIILMDARYNSEKIQGKLPGWIRSGLVTEDNRKGGFGDVMSSVTGFFRGRKNVYG
ncbi:MAG: hypothetical protein M1819_006779 [Sarea resinae]|nr:MAG: hypothetical protein M1819_006779 [Sarea resinae]